MSQLPSNQVTGLLLRWKGGDQNALEALVPLVYEELRRLAHHYLRAERPDHSLESTALVHEAYLRLVQHPPGAVQNRAHFFALAAQLMRQILVGFARCRGAAKRDHALTLTLAEGVAFKPARNLDIVALDDALCGLSRLSPRQSRIVELRFFAGLSIKETSEVLSVSPATVERDWTSARTWLYREMNRTTPL